MGHRSKLSGGATSGRKYPTALRNGLTRPSGEIPLIHHFHRQMKR